MLTPNDLCTLSDRLMDLQRAISSVQAMIGTTNSSLDLENSLTLQSRPNGNGSRPISYGPDSLANRIIAALANGRPHTRKGIAREAGTTPPTVSFMMPYLIRDGKVERVARGVYQAV